MIPITAIEVFMKRTYSGYETENYDVIRSWGTNIFSGRSSVDGFYVRNKQTREKVFHTSLRDARKYLIKLGETV